MKVNKRQAESIAWSFAAVLMIRAKGTGALHAFLASIGVDGHKQPQSWDNAFELFDRVIDSAWSRAGFKRLLPGEAPPEIVESENSHAAEKLGELWKAIDAMIDHAEASTREFPTFVIGVVEPAHVERLRKEKADRSNREAFALEWNRDEHQVEHQAEHQVEHQVEHQAESNPIVRCGDCASWSKNGAGCGRGYAGPLDNGTCVDWSEKI